jgi:Spy/CpxP family protein refolding chaperone
MSLHRALWLSLPLVLALPLAACKDTTPEAPPAPTATAAVKAPVPGATATATAAPSAAEHGRDHNRWRRGGVGGMLLRGARELDLKEPQKATVSKLGEQLKGAAEAPRAALKDYHMALAAQVRAGKIDTAKLDALEAASEKSMQATKDKEAEALNALHAALEPAQRKALVASVREKQGEHPQKAHEGPKPTDADRAMRQVEHLTKELDLDADQQKKVEALLAKSSGEHATPEAMRDEMKQHSDAVLAAFEGDAFDARKLETPAATPKKGPMAEHAQLVTQILPLLKPEQREKLAVQEEKQFARPQGEGQEPEGEAPEAPAAP